MIKKGKLNETAVSPVVGVMMMLVVTIIIAAIVSAFAGSTVSSQAKVPQATIQAKFSVANGMEITHAGGDPLATNDIVFVVRNSALFGPNLEQKTAQVLNKSIIQSDSGLALDNGDGTSEVTAFISGEKLYIFAANSTCAKLQPDVFSYNEAYCFASTANVGKTFSLEVSDKKGNLISKTDVVISA